MPRKPRVVVVGAGFAGVRIAKGLESSADVTLVAPSDRFVYLPLIHEVLSETVLPRDVTKRLTDVLPKTTLIHGRGKAVDGTDLVLASGERIPFDRLVVAVGAEPNDFGVPGVKAHALSFYSVGDALQANAMLKFKATEIAGRPLRVTVVGASFTGVEVAGEAAELLDKLEVPREITLLDALPTVFPRQRKEFQDGVHAGLKRLELEVHMEQKITEVGPDAVTVATDDATRSIPSDVTFWCAGAKPRGITGVDANVRGTLQSTGRDDVYVAGDAANFPREMGVPKLAQTAEDQASVVLANILSDTPKRTYAPSIKGIIVSIGHNYAVAELNNGAVFTGRIPWHVKRNLYKAKIALV